MHGSQHAATACHHSAVAACRPFWTESTNFAQQRAPFGRSPPTLRNSVPFLDGVHQLCATACPFWTEPTNFAQHCAPFTERKTWHMHAVAYGPAPHSLHCRPALPRQVQRSVRHLSVAAMAGLSSLRQTCSGFQLVSKRSLVTWKGRLPCQCKPGGDGGCSDEGGEGRHSWTKCQELERVATSPHQPEAIIAGLLARQCGQQIL